MKVNDLRRRFMTSLVAGGMLAPSALFAANLNTNLIINGDFESVDDTGTLGAYNSPKINFWTAASVDKQGFAYSHDGSLSAGNVVPNYANGAPLASGGHWYFSPNAGTAGPNVVNGPGQFFQDIDVSTGPSGTLIASGNAAYRISAYFNSYLAQGDIGHLHLNFLNNSNVSLGMAEVAGQLPLNQWTQNSRGGLIPVGTSTVRVSIFGTTPIAGGPDGYMDNVDFQVSNEVIQPVLSLGVNRDTGILTIINQTGAPVNLKSYSITSAFEALEPANWKSIADNYDAGNPGAGQFDTIHNWSKLTDPTANGDLSEADLEAGAGAALAHTRTLVIGNSNAWIKTPTEDLVFQYISGAEIKTGIVSYTGHGGIPFMAGDLNVDSAIDSADWMILRSNQHTSLAGKSLAEAYRLGDLNGDKLNNFEDFAAFKSLYDAANGAGAFAAMVASVPEPSAILIVLAAGIVRIPGCGRHRLA